MDMDTALFYLGIQTYKAMEAEEVATRLTTEVEQLNARIHELENPEMLVTQKEGGQ